MTGLTHEQARRFLNIAADRCLTAQDSAALDAHLAECATCRSYATDLIWLNNALVRALRSRWIPRRAPVDIASHVRQRMRTDAGRRFFVGFAQAFVKLGSLVAVMTLVAGIFHSTRWREPASETPITTPTSSAIHHDGLPSFEFEPATGDSLIIGSPQTEIWIMPALMRNRLRVTRY